MGIRTVLGVVLTERIMTPALFGFIRPRLLLPNRILETLSLEDMRYIFLHELAHLKRHDILFGWVAALLQALHWFNPLVWLAFRRMRMDRELACDALALSSLRSEKVQAYGRTIVNLLERFSQPRRLPALAGILESKSHLKRRITMIARFKKHSYRWSALAVAALVMLGSVTLTGAPASSGAAKATAKSKLLKHGSVAPYFGPVIERVLNSPDVTSVNTFINLDTGELFSLPEGFNRKREAMNAWVEEKQVDLCVGDLIKHLGKADRIRFIGLGAILVPKTVSHWDTLTPTSAQTAIASLAGPVSGPRADHLQVEQFRKEYPARTFLFKTRDGGAGLLQVVGFNEEGTGIKIRYKMLRQGQPGDTLPSGWTLNYDDGTSDEREGWSHWAGSMARNLSQLRAIPAPANEYDGSWKEERLRLAIRSLDGEHMGEILFQGQTKIEPMILASDKYILSYTRGSVDLESNCTIPLDRAEFIVDLSQPGMYELRFSPKLEKPKVTEEKWLPTTCVGTVVDSNGNPLKQADVAAYEMFFNMAGGLDLRLIGEAVTKKDGRFVFETRPSVKKKRSMDGIVVAKKNGSALGWAKWPLYGAQKVTIKLARPMILAGWIVDKNGEGVAGAEVRAVLFKKKVSEKEETMWLPGIRPLRWLAVRSDRKGYFEFDNIPVYIRADFVVTAAGFGTIYTHKPENLRTGYEGAEFAPGTMDIRITMAPGGTIEGKVIESNSGEGVGGGKLAVVPTFSGYFFHRFVCISKKDGTFSIGGLQSGEYLIRGNAQEGFGRANVVVESGKMAGDVIINWTKPPPPPAAQPAGSERIDR